ncbi:uncharacterized protein A4U43_C02F8150 [Asparagus officinalis]|uniref:Alpha-carbonic anhydrase domain-containing protein n=1 Tax=Asparagus officinalis TaxID=4686 RepID=A0A5P1FHQ2_ASPOF|nr:alpha carbonic anhydrase 1, chloroplastic-like [Asparagus officinalis]ONK77584.1 uncharacterized protein A4U43_C02F8150 [Asparagus officinalis]
MLIVAQYIVFALGLTSLLASFTAVAGQDFGYGNGPNGPQKWGDLKHEWTTCGAGKQQSPIDIPKIEVDDKNDKLGSLTRDYVDSKATLINNGFNVELRYEEGVGSVTADGRNYSLQQLNWHTPSEHTLNGERFPAELQMVHRTQDGLFAVVSILYQIGDEDTFLNQLMEGLKRLEKEKCDDNQEARISVGKVDNKALRRSTKKYFRYLGSLTTPPCTEFISWTIMGKIREMSQAQVDALKAPLAEAYRNNSRPIQPLNGRTVMLFAENKDKPSV